MNKIKANKGNTGVDIVISIGIITVILTILVALYMSLYIANSEIERRTQAMDYASQILEKIEEFYYADVNDEEFQVTALENGNNQIAGIEIPKGYEVAVEIVPYSENEQSDVVKSVEVTVTYTVAEKEEDVTLTYYKTKETLIIPNAPELGDDLLPIRAQNDGEQTTYKIVNEIEQQWYSYPKRIWPLAIPSHKANNVIQTEDVYVWIPRFAYYEETSQQADIVFLYADKDQTVDTLGNLQDIPDEYIIDSSFEGDNATGYWILLSQIKTDSAASVLNDSEYGELIY